MCLSLKLSLTGLALFLLAGLGGCSCGFDCHSDNNGGGGSDPAVLSLGLSDSLPEDLKQVVIKVDTITFKRSGSSDIVVEKFTPTSGVQVETFQVDLLQYRGVNNLQVISGLQMQTGSYSSVEIKTVADGTYVTLQNDTVQPLTITNNVLQIPGMQLASGPQTFVIEFGLAQALQQQNNNYLLTNNGIRMENAATDATLSGTVDATLFNSVTPCVAKTNPQAGNRVYLYKKSTLSTLGDVFTNTTNVPASVQAPFAVASLVQDTSNKWQYSFGYLPAGDYTMAFACNTAADDSVNYNALVIPQPTTQKYTLSLTAGKDTVCNIADGASC